MYVYIAALLGFGPADVRGWRRAACLAFSAISLPGEFFPAVIALAGKSREAREVRRARTVLDRQNDAARDSETVASRI